MNITQNKKEYFRKIAKLDPTGRYVFVGEMPLDHGLTDFNGYYGVNSGEPDYWDNLTGNSPEPYYMERTQWEKVFGPYQPDNPFNMTFTPNDKVRVKLTSVGKQQVLEWVDQQNEEYKKDGCLIRQGIPWDSDDCITDQYHTIMKYFDWKIDYTGLILPFETIEILPIQ